MYVEDMTIADAKAFLGEALLEAATLRFKGRQVPEYLEWDIEDLEGRIAELTA